MQLFSYENQVVLIPWKKQQKYTIGEKFMNKRLPMDKTLQERFKRRMNRSSIEPEGQPFNFSDPTHEIHQSQYLANKRRSLDPNQSYGAVQTKQLILDKKVSLDFTTIQNSYFPTK